MASNHLKDEQDLLENVGYFNEIKFKNRKEAKPSSNLSFDHNLDSAQQKNKVFYDPRR